MGMTFIDKSDEPTSIEDIEEALHTVEVIMVKHALVLPMFTVNAGNIRRCLQEYLALRKKFEELQKGEKP